MSTRGFLKFYRVKIAAMKAKLQWSSTLYLQSQKCTKHTCTHTHTHTHTLTVTLRTSTVPINASQNANTLQNTNSKETKNRNIPPTCQYDQTYWNEQATCPHLQHTVPCGHTNLTHSIKYQGAANALYLNSGRSCNIHPIMHQVRCTICRTDLLCNPSFNMATHTHTHGQDW